MTALHVKARFLRLLTGIVLLTAPVPGFFGCSSGASLYLNADRTGSADVEIRLHNALAAYIRDILEFSGESALDVPLFDTEKMKTGIDAQKGLSLTHADVPDKNSLQAKVTFSDLNAVFPEGISLKKEAAGNTMTVLITRNNYRRILARYFELAALEDKEDYLWGLLEPSPEDALADMYDYAFGEYLDKGETIRAVLRQSSINLTVTFPGAVVSQTGGVQKGRNTVAYVIPLTDILTMQKPVLLTAVYK